jgi:hypothetical protein
VPDFCHGRQLRDYQRVSLEWNIINWSQGRNCILGDEVRAFCRRSGRHARGRVCVVCPLLANMNRCLMVVCGLPCVPVARL